MANAGNSNRSSEMPSQSSGSSSSNGDWRRPIPRSQSACGECTRSSHRCDGARPRCGRCLQQDLGCVYEVDMQNGLEVRDMELRLESANAELDSLVFLLQAMREGTEVEARILLEQLRACGDIRAFAQMMRRRGATDGAQVRN